MQHKILKYNKSTFMHAEKIICTLNRHLLFTSLFIFLLSSATIWRGIWRALIYWRRLSQNTPSKIQKIIQENLSKSQLCVPVRNNPLHTKWELDMVESSCSMKIYGIQLSRPD